MSNDQKSLALIVVISTIALYWGFRDTSTIEQLPLSENPNVNSQNESALDSNEKPNYFKSLEQIQASPNTFKPAPSSETDGADEPAVEEPVSQVSDTPPDRPSLNQTMDSISYGEIQQTQMMQRNLYFQKLSEELKTIQEQSGSDENTFPNMAQPPLPPGSPEQSLDNGEISSPDGQFRAPSPYQEDINGEEDEEVIEENLEQDEDDLADEALPVD